jgi:hypothetical protein
MESSVCLADLLTAPMNRASEDEDEDEPFCPRFMGSGDLQNWMHIGTMNGFRADLWLHNNLRKRFMERSVPAASNRLNFSKARRGRTPAGQRAGGLPSLPAGNLLMLAITTVYVR